MKHIEVHTQKRNERTFPCDICNKNFRTLQNLKSHIVKIHNNTDEKINANQNHQNIKNNQQSYNNSNKSDNIPLDRICSFWNRGFCKFEDRKCRFLHINLPKCRYKDKCFRYNCSFYHEAATRKYPFLERLTPIEGHLKSRNAYQHNKPEGGRIFPRYHRN